MSESKPTSQSKTLALRLLETEEISQVAGGDVCLTIDTFCELAGGVGRDDTRQTGPGCPPTPVASVDFTTP